MARSVIRGRAVGHTGPERHPLPESGCSEENEQTRQGEQAPGDTREVGRGPKEGQVRVRLPALEPPWLWLLGHSILYPSLTGVLCF